MKTPVYMDNHATTRVDPRVLEAMQPYFCDVFGNAASVSHPFGSEAKEAVDAARLSIAEAIGAKAKEIVFTSGATESNNLALRGVVERPRQENKHLVSVATEHRAVIDPLKRLARRGFEVTFLPVVQDGDPLAGCIAAEQVDKAIREDTILVSVMLANNEIGAIHPLAEIGAVCKKHEVLLHCDATQAVGKIPVDVQQLQIDLMSFSAHKIYGPKGIGALYFRRSRPAVRLESQILGGGHEGGVRSGTLNAPGIVGFAKALELCLEEMPEETERLRQLRNRLYEGLVSSVDGTHLNGPALEKCDHRLAGNLNISFDYVDGEALLMSTQNLALSSGSACTSAEPEPSQVLKALGLSEDRTRSSIRFGLGRFNTLEEVQFAIDTVREAVERLRKLSGMI